MKNTWNDFVKPIVVLGVICLVTSLLLAVTNNVTAPIIAENAVKTANATRQALLPSADCFTEVAPETPTEGVTAIYKADNDSGYALRAGKGLRRRGARHGGVQRRRHDRSRSIPDNDETPGLGQKVKSEAFQSQFSGMPAEEFGLSDIDAITGATISSGAAASAINAAIAAYNQEAGVAGEDLSTLSPEELHAALLPDAGAITPVDVSADGVTEAYKGEAYGVVIYAQAEGFYKKPVTAAVGFDDDGVITGVYRRLQ
ncbi:MAG: FMN-binding protein [Ruthenibacterium lactatiformans]